MLGEEELITKRTMACARGIVNYKTHIESVVLIYNVQHQTLASQRLLL